MNDRRQVRREIIKSMRVELDKHPIDPEDARAKQVRKRVRWVLTGLEGNSASRALGIRMVEDPECIPDGFLFMWHRGHGSAGSVLTVLHTLGVTEGDMPGGKVKAELR